jgi:O-antigen ligase
VRSFGGVAAFSLAALGYVILLGGTGRGELDGTLHVVNGLVAAFFVVVYVTRAPAVADRIDRGILVSLLLFLGAAILSQFPRQSFDAALGALTATSAFFVLRGELNRPEVRRVFVNLFVLLSTVMTFVTAALWLPAFFEWWALTGWDVVPPLDLNFSAAPWGHRHDLALLVVLLYPSQWIAPLSVLRRAVAGLFGVLVLLIVIVDGSRNLWLAVLVATAAVLLPLAYRRLRSSRRARRTALIGVLVAVAFLLVSGLAAALLDRVLNLQSLGWRSAMWIPLFEAWTQRPLAGYGPGSFAWILPTTDYYDTSSWAPRHPDSAFFQLLAEGGLLGIAAMVVVLGTLILPVLRGRSTAARWALITFVVACVGANPTDFGFLVAVAIGWTAFATPREGTESERRPAGRRILRGGSFAALMVVAIAFTSTTAAGIAYETASDAVNARDLGQARSALDVAMALDPGMALYPRQRGSLDYVTGAADAGISDLELATRMNPSDDLAWRTLALAYVSVGNETRATAAIDHALDAQRSDAANLLLLAREQVRANELDDALATLAEVVQSWPAIVGAPLWREFLPPSVSTSDVIAEANHRWESGRTTPEPFAGQGLWLAVLGGRPDLEESAVEASGVSEGLARAAMSVFGCAAGAPEDLVRLADSDRRTQMYWELTIRQAALDAADYSTARTLLEIMKGYPILPETADDRLNPLVETGFSADIWGYRRRPITWRTTIDDMPSPDAGSVRWLYEPIDAGEAAAVSENLPDCY